MTDERIRALERSLANAPQDTGARLALARELARVGRRDDARSHVARVLRAEPLSEEGVRTLDDLGFGPLAHDAPWPTEECGNDRARRSVSPGARRGELVKRIRIGKDSERPTAMTVSAETAYVATSLGRLVALSLPGGEPRWVREFGHDVSAPAIGIGERLLIGGNGGLQLLSAESGETLWITRLPGRAATGAIPATFAPSGLALARSGDALHACSARDGRVLWSAASATQPVVLDASIFVAEQNGEVKRLDVTGVVRATTRIPRDVRDARLNGSQLWLEAGAPPRVKQHILPLAADGSFAGARRGQAALGGQRWGCALSEGRALLRGELAWLHDPEGGSELARFIAAAIADSGGCFFAVHEGGVGWFDSTGALVKNILPGANDVGPMAIGPDSTLLVASPRNILHVIA